MSDASAAHLRPPLVGAGTWHRVMDRAAWACECVGECGATHAKSEGRCDALHGATKRLCVVTADPAAPLHAAVSGDAELVVRCAACITGVTRTANKTAATNVGDQLDLFGGDAA